ncbi:MAG TPA: type I phosphomannose isomerase catalytic subunit [Chthoniobacteraceae bacterium]|jgi:mannose-6-phosphate isomerase
MEFSSPIVFEPLFMERVWGGRRLESFPGKRLPQSSRIGESWEIVDREEAQSVVHDGPFRGVTLHELWTERRAEVFGEGLPDSPRFPVLCKLLDAQERLSVQVHPSPLTAAKYGGECKSEVWYVMDALLDSDLYAGLKRGVTRDSFEDALRNGKVADQVFEMPVKKGDAIFIPSGRVHAIGAGNVIAEIQQNSDTTYRVFDWNRIGFDGRPRDLHIEESLASINFEDIEPKKIDPGSGDVLVACEFFRVERWSLTGPRAASDDRRFSIFTVVEGSVECGGRSFSVGSFFLVPPRMQPGEIAPREGSAAVLRTTIP